MPWKNPEKQREAIRRHYQNNRQYYIEKSYKKRNDLRRWTYQLKESTPCKDCGKLYPYYVMDFDHLSDKMSNISKLLNSGSIKRVKEEIEKCEIVCANCHRRRTFKRNPSRIDYISTMHP